MAACKEASVDAAVATVLSEPDGVKDVKIRTARNAFPLGKDVFAV